MLGVRFCPFMPKAERFPLNVRDGAVSVKIYRQKARTNDSGFAYVVSWVGGDGRQRKTFARLDDAKLEAGSKASQLAAGLSTAGLLTRSDIFELSEARATVGLHGIPLLSAVAEWSKARELAGAALIEACSAWSERRTSQVKRIRVPAAVDAFIADKDAANKKGSRTYSAKLKPLKAFFGEVYLDTIPVAEWTRYLRQFEDSVTRNDLRKRAVTLCRWAQRHGHLAEGIVPEAERTERAKERATPIGILTPSVLHDLLHHFRRHYQEHLAALVVANLCGVRSDEIQGKRDHRERRQSWEDVHIDRRFMSVSAAKENTPSSRMVALSDAAVAWLGVCPGTHRGPIGEAGVMERARALAIADGFQLPDNCFRHSWITYCVALTGNKPAVANEAGNSVKEIDRRYRVPRPKEDGVAWFATRPTRPPATRRPSASATKSRPPAVQTESPAG